MSNSQTLLERAYEFIDSIKGVIGRSPDWTLGGGTVPLRHQHRDSKDNDAFLADHRPSVYLMLKSGAVYPDLGSDHADRRDKTAQAHRMGSDAYDPPDAQRIGGRKWPKPR